MTRSSPASCPTSEPSAAAPCSADRNAAMSSMDWKTSPRFFPTIGTGRTTGCALGSADGIGYQCGGAMNAFIPRRILRALGPACALIFVAGCASPPPPPPPSPAPAARSVTETHWLATKVFHEEFTHPSNTCQQVFRIAGNSEMTWIIEFSPEGYSYGAIVLRKPCDLFADRANARIAFNIRPALRAPELRAGLVDDRGVMIDAPVAGSGCSDISWRSIAIPLSDFPERGINTRADAAEPTAIFDWSAVREFRLIAGGRSRTQPVEIRLLRIVKE